MRRSWVISALYASGCTDLLQDAQNAARATKVAYLDYLRLSGQARVYRNQGHFARCDRKWDEASHALFDALNHRVQWVLLALGRHLHKLWITRCALFVPEQPTGLSRARVHEGQGQSDGARAPPTKARHFPLQARCRPHAGLRRHAGLVQKPDRSSLVSAVRPGQAAACMSRTDDRSACRLSASRYLTPMLQLKHARIRFGMKTCGGLLRRTTQATPIYSHADQGGRLR